MFNSDLSTWDVGNVTRIDRMFSDATSFSSDIGSWDVRKVTNMTRMFSNAGLATADYDAILSGWSVQNVQCNLNLDADGVNYCRSEGERELLLRRYDWTINDTGLDCSVVSVGDQEDLGVSVFPNPVSNILYLQGNEDQVKATIFDISGNEVFSQHITNSLDLSYLNKGIYIIHLSDQQKSSSHVIIKE